MKDRRFHAGLVALLVVVSTGCMDPEDRRPGLRLSGELVNEAINDWSFSDAYQEIYLETQTWYMIPHSVTTVCAGVGEKLYVPTIYFEGGEWPDKFWNSNVNSDPRVRLEMGGKIYEREAVVVDDPTEIQVALRALAAKYPFWQEQLSKPENERPDMAMVRMDPRGSER
jgi:hypothetical protein